MKILLIEDDLQLANQLTQQLTKATFAVDVYGSVEESLIQAIEFNQEYDCIVLDINLPDGNGFDFCSQLRKEKIITPIIMMTARDALTDKIKGLDLGADDYVTKPVDFIELLARIRAIIRRNSKDPSPIMKIGNLSIDPQTHRVKRGLNKIELSSKEFAILEFLSRHHDEVVTRTMIMEHAWGSDFETLSNVIDVYIKNLRKKIDAKNNKKLLHTIRGSGYSLSDKR